MFNDHNMLKSKVLNRELTILHETKIYWPSWICPYGKHQAYSIPWLLSPMQLQCIIMHRPHWQSYVRDESKYEIIPPTTKEHSVISLDNNFYRLLRQPSNDTKYYIKLSCMFGLAEKWKQRGKPYFSFMKFCTVRNSS